MTHFAPTSAVSFLALVPPSVLPAEGDDDFSLPSGPITVRDLLAAFQRHATPRAPRFVILNSEVSLLADDAFAVGLLSVHQPAAADDAPMAVGAASTTIDWAAVAVATETRLAEGTSLGTPDEAVRCFFEEAREAIRLACAGFAGEPIPLLAARKTDDGGAEIAFLGVWLARPQDIESLRTSTSARPMDEGAAWAEATTLLLDTAEVEGHGLREIALSLSLLAVICPAMPAQAGLLGFLEPAPMTADGRPAAKGEELKIKSQKLRQKAPVVYKSVLQAATPESQRKVMVDIAGQRAYLFVDGQLAFETPVSTASAGRYTPRGTFTVTEKINAGKYSTIYKSPMPHWMRLGQTPIGMHTGQLPGYPASHGCVRMPDEAADFMFKNLPRGSTVQVVSSMQAPGPPALVAAQ